MLEMKYGLKTPTKVLVTDMGLSKTLKTAKTLCPVNARRRMD